MVLRKFREILLTRKDHLAEILTQEVGKPITQSRNELNGVIGRIDFFLDEAAGVIQEQVVLENSEQGLREKISHEPLGVIGQISAWNYPYFVGSNVFVPALLTGNAVLYKPSEYATLTGLAIEEMLHQAGVPQGVFSLILGTGNAGAELVKLPLNGLFFTGSYSTGKKISEAIASRFIKSQFELGGKDPVYVCDDVSVSSVAAAVADGAFYNTGQSCCSVERIYVHEKIYDSFIESFVKTVDTFVLGDPLQEQTYIGPLTRGAHLEFLEHQISDALKKGAKLLRGGKRAKTTGYYFEPTVLVNVDSSMKVMREETFGPMIGIQKVKDDEEAIRFMNDTPYGLTSSVYTQNQNRASAILTEMNSGTVYWNCCDRVSPRLPWSGRGHSGIGCTLSKYGIQTFVQPKAWHLKTGN